MSREFRKSNPASREKWEGKYKFEHWYRDRTVYFITARVADGLHLFQDPACQQIFWTKFEQYTRENAFDPWVATLMSNHYHVVGFAHSGPAIGQMMRKLHGSVAWMVCKELNVKHKPFWRDSASNDYMDGCLRDITQLKRSYAYVRDQAVRARIVSRWEDYPNTRMYVPLNVACEFATTNDGFLESIPYPRYERRG